MGVSNYKDEIYNCYNAGRIIARKNGLCGAILGAASGNVHDNDRVAVEPVLFPEGYDIHEQCNLCREFYNNYQITEDSLVYKSCFRDEQCL